MSEWLNMSQSGKEEKIPEYNQYFYLKTKPKRVLVQSFLKVKGLARIF